MINMRQKENNISYIGKPFLFPKKKTLGKRKRMDNNIEHLGNEDKKEKRVKGERNNTLNKGKEIKEEKRKPSDTKYRNTAMGFSPVEV